MPDPPARIHAWVSDAEGPKAVKLSTTSATLTIQTPIGALLVPGCGETPAVAFNGAVCGVSAGCPAGGDSACPQWVQNFAVSAFSALQCRQSMSGLTGYVIHDGAKTGLRFTAVGPEFESKEGRRHGEYENIFQRIRNTAQI